MEFGRRGRKKMVRQAEEKGEVRRKKERAGWVL